jgi:four helix bundle protein
MTINDYKKLNIWQKGIEIANELYCLTDKFPKHEIYGLTSQMRRAAVSIPSNIAEGFARNHDKEYKQFLYIALGSCAELETLELIAGKRKYFSEIEEQKIEEMLNHEIRMIVNLNKKIIG